MIQTQTYVIALTRGRKTRFFYGERLKDALALAKPRQGEEFVYAKMERGPEFNAAVVNGVLATKLRGRSSAYGRNAA